LMTLMIPALIDTTARSKFRRSPDFPINVMAYAALFTTGSLPSCTPYEHADEPAPAPKSPAPYRHPLQSPRLNKSYTQTRRPNYEPKLSQSSYMIFPDRFSTQPFFRLCVFESRPVITLPSAFFFLQYGPRGCFQAATETRPCSCSSRKFGDLFSAPINFFEYVSENLTLMFSPPHDNNELLRKLSASVF